MNKRITSIVLCLVLLVSLMASAIPVFADTTVNFTVTADKTEAAVGDTITYTVSVGAAENIAGIVFCMNIPEGLTFVGGSSSVPANLKADLGFSEASFAEETLYFVGLANDAMVLEGETVLMTFKCTVKEGTTGTQTVVLEGSEDEIFDTDDNNVAFTVENASIVVGGSTPDPDPEPATELAFKVSADKATAKAGDTITYTVTVSAAENIGGIVFHVTIPAGLTFAAGSSNVPANLKADLGFSEASFAEETMYFVGLANDAMVLEGETVLMTFKCTVKEGVIGTQEVTIEGSEDEIFDINDNNVPFTTIGATVTIEATVCAHDWEAADCDTPKTCKLCGETEGAALGHDWEAADCDTAKTCKVCGATEGSALGHTTVTYTNNGDTHSATYDCCGAAYVTNEDHSYDATTKTCVCGAVKADDFYTAAGSEGLFGSNWDPADMNNLLVLDTTTGIYSKTYTNVSAGSYEFKVVLNGAWGTEYNLEGNASFGGGNAVANVTEDGSTVIIGFNGEKVTLQIIAPACEHDWDAADCDTPKTCKLCGETEGEALGHDWTDADCENPKTCKVCGATEGEALGHDWADADCENPKTCKVCGATEGEALGHDWTDADCENPKTCKVCGATEGEALGHDWADADCENPKTCKVCGATEGEALGHSWSEATCTEPKHCTVCGHSVGTASHDWTDADCENPKTCKICGETEGEALGHDWEAADCDTAKTCKVCGATEGEALGHDWEAADCDTAKTCKVCGATEGEPNGHSWNEDYSSNDEQHWIECSVCGETKDVGDHADEDADEKCDACGYDMPTTDEPGDEPGEEPVPGTGDVSMMIMGTVLMITLAFGVVLVCNKKKFIV